MSMYSVAEIYNEAFKPANVGVNINTLLVPELPVQAAWCMAKWANELGQLLLAAVTVYSDDVLPFICSKYEFDRLPIHAYCTFNYMLSADNIQRSSLTHNLHKQHGLVLSSRVGDADGVVALILPLCTLYDEAAQVFPWLHPHTALSACNCLINRKLQHRRSMNYPALVTQIDHVITSTK